MSIDLDQLRKLCKEEVNFDKIVEIVKEVPIDDLKWEGGETLLFWAGYYGNIKLVTYLIEDLGIHVNTFNLYQETALYYAAMNDHREVIGYLLKNQAIPRLKSNRSGLFPIDIVKDSKEVLEFYDEKVVPFNDYTKGNTLKDNFTKYVSYYYRLYINSLFDLQSGKIPVDTCKNLLTWYYTILLSMDPSKPPTRKCLACHTTNNLKKCSCESVYFCSPTCQTNCFVLHKYDHSWRMGIENEEKKEEITNVSTPEGD